MLVFNTIAHVRNVFRWDRDWFHHRAFRGVQDWEIPNMSYGGRDLPTPC